MLDPQIGAMAGGLLAGVGAMAYAVRGRSANIFGDSVYHGTRSRAALALTFDDGPSESTPTLLNILAEHKILATFFMCGSNVRRCPAIARQVAAAGHEIGNHSDSHPRMDFHSPEFIYSELLLAQETIRQVTGVAPRLFRAPYGVRWYGLRSAQRRLNLLGVMWTVNSHDWRWPSHRIIPLLNSRSSNGSILLMHDGRETAKSPDIRATLDTIEVIIPALKDRGFQFETVSQILCPAT